MTKSQIRSMIETKTAEYLANGGEILRGETAEWACELARLKAREKARGARREAMRVSRDWRG